MATPTNNKIKKNIIGHSVTESTHIHMNKTASVNPISDYYSNKVHKSASCSSSLDSSLSKFITTTRNLIGYKTNQKKYANCASLYSCVVAPLSYRQRSRHLIESFPFHLSGALASTNNLFVHSHACLHALRRQLAWRATCPTMIRGSVIHPHDSRLLSRKHHLFHPLSSRCQRTTGWATAWLPFPPESKRPATSGVAAGLLPTIPSTGLRTIALRKSISNMLKLVK